MISAIRWVSELIAIAGGIDVFAELGLKAGGKDRIVADAAEPAATRAGHHRRQLVRQEVSAAPTSRRARAGPSVPAVANGELHEIQVLRHPAAGSPAGALTDGLEQLHTLFAAWVARAG